MCKKVLTAFCALALVMTACLGISAFSDETADIPELGRIVYDGMNITYIDPDGSESSPDKVDTSGGLRKNSVPTLRSQVFPSYYDLRGVDGVSYVTAPEKQGFGDCWTYATMSSLESNAMMRGYGEQHFSKSHLGYFSFTPENEGIAFDEPFDVGGNYIMSIATLANLEGIASLSDYPNAQTGNPPVYGEEDRFNHSSGFILDDAVVLKDTAEIKSWIMENGAVFSGMASYDSLGSINRTYNAYMLYNHYGENYINHAITIVGWRDDIPASAFTSCWGETPTHNGAWIIKNSWAGNAYDYMYLSYDQYLSTAVGFSVQPFGEIYNHYTYSERDANGYFTSTHVDYGNVYTAENDEEISQIGFMIDTENAITDVTATFKIYKNLPLNYSSPESGTLAGTYTAHYGNDGYYTFDVPETVSVEQGEIYSVIVTLTDSAGCQIKQLIELGDEGVYHGETRQSYYKNGSRYRDLYADYGSQGAGNTYMHIYTRCHHSTATRTEENRQVTYCTRCGKILGYHCFVHTPGEMTYTAEPTCIRAGRAVCTCAYCEEQYTLDIPAYGHSFGPLTEYDVRNTNEVVYERYCSRCGYVEQSRTYIKGSNVITLGELIRLFFERLFAIFSR